jgi:hypothetical protein
LHAWFSSKHLILTRPPRIGQEYIRRKGNVVIRSNTIQGVSSVLKRGVIGVYQHCGEAHLPRHLAEFDFSYNCRAALKVTDTESHYEIALMIGGKRLTYRRIGEANYA